MGAAILGAAQRGSPPHDLGGTALDRTEHRQRLSPWVELLEVEVGPAGARATYHGLALGDYATALAVRPDGRFLVVCQYRPVVDRRVWEFPGGLVDPGETAGAAACRETFEETGHRVTAHHVLTPLLVDGGRLLNRAHGIVALVEPTPSGPAEPGIEVDAVTWPELGRLILDGGFAEANHVALVAQAIVDPGAAALLDRHGVAAPWRG